MRRARTNLQHHSRSIGAVASTILLAAACLGFAIASHSTLPPVLAQQLAREPGVETGDRLPQQAEIVAIVQDTPEEPTSEALPTADETAEPAPGETTEAPSETDEPAPGETLEPPPETAEPTPGEPEVTEALVTALKSIFILGLKFHVDWYDHGLKFISPILPVCLFL